MTIILKMSLLIFLNQFNKIYDLRMIFYEKSEKYKFENNFVGPLEKMPMHKVI